ncbi:MAG: PAS domain S-box protein [Promethearchaeota archaeon]
MSNDKIKVHFSENQFNIFFKNIPIPIYAWQKVNNDLILIDYNYAAEEITDGNIKNFLGNTASEIYKDKVEILKDLRRCAHDQISFSKEVKYIMKNMGEKKFLKIKYVFIYPDLVLVHIEDFTEIKQVKEKIKKLNQELENKFEERTKELKESEEKFRTIAEESLTGLVILQDNLFKFVNKQYIKMSGYSVEELKSWAPGEFLKTIHPEDRAIVMEQARKKQIGLKNVINNYQFRAIKKTGEIIWIDIFSKTINYDGKLADLIAVVDITSKKEAEQKLKESEEKFKMITEQSLMGICIVQDYKFKYINKTYADIWGYSVEEIMNWGSRDFIKRLHPDDKNFILDQLRKKQKGDQDIVIKYPCRGFRKSGEIIWGEIFSKPVFYKGKSADLVTIIDITEQKNAEEKLKESEEKYRLITENANDLIAVYNEKLECEYVNEKVLKNVLGYSFDDIKGKFSLKTIHPDEIKTSITNFKKVFENGKGIGEVRIKSKDGTYKWIESKGKVYVENGEKKLILISRDITKRKNAEQKLKDSEETYRKISERYEMLLDSITDAVFVINPEWEFTLFNKMAKEIGNKPVEDKLGHKLTEINPGVVQTPFFKTYETVMNTRKPARVRGKFTFPNRPTRDYEVRVYPISEGILCLGRDITEQIEAEQKLKESEEKFRTIAEQSIMGIFILQDDLIKYANQGMSEIIGYSIEEMKNWAPGEFIKFIDPDSRDFFKNQVNTKKLDLKDRISHYKLQIIRKNGEKKWLEIFSKSINYRGRLANFFTTMDITEKKVAEEELIKLNKLKSDLLRRTSHELKTPLVSIKGNTHLLLKLHYEKLDNFTISILEEIEEGCERLEDLIKQLIESSILESGQVQLNASKEDLAFLINFCVRELKSLANVREQKIHIAIQEKLITRFEKEKIYEVIINLLSNAIKYTPKNGKIKITSEIKDNFYIISVKDNGIGFTEEEKKQIFKQFGKIERYGQGWDLGIEGSGLGLYISKKIVELHGGKIWAESEGRNKGSVFSFSLPIINN